MVHIHTQFEQNVLWALNWFHQGHDGPVGFRILEAEKVAINLLHNIFSGSDANNIQREFGSEREKLGGLHGEQINAKVGAHRDS